MPANIFVDRRKEIELFLSLFSPGARRRALMFYHAGREHGLGSSYLLEFLASVQVDQLTSFAFRTPDSLSDTEANRLFDTPLHRILFRCEVGTPEKVYYYRTFLEKTVETIGREHFPKYQETVDLCKRNIEKKPQSGPRGQVIFHKPIFEKTIIHKIVGTESQLPSPGFNVDFETKYFNSPKVRDEITRAFLLDLCNLSDPVVWLIDGPWSPLEPNTLGWLRSILKNVSRGVIQNLWVIVGGREPIQDVGVLESYPGIFCCSLERFTPDAVRDYLDMYLVLPSDFAIILAQAIWRLSGGHPGKVSTVIVELCEGFPNLCRPDIGASNRGVVWQR